jgi:anti-sigma regulatory factor (Ser/Thr protein kinase)
MPGTPAISVMVSETLAKEPMAPAKARRLLDRFGSEVPREQLDDARLLLSEVVTNAVEHVDEPGEIELNVSYEDSRLRVEVEDPGAGFTPRERDPDNHRGWGLQFVQRLSDRWGVAAGERSCVWFELAA